MADSFVQVPPDSTGKQVDAASLPVGGQTVLRQRVVLGDNTGTATYATILSAGPAGTEGGLVVRNIPSGTQSIVGQVAVTGTIALGAGTANIGTINNISAGINLKIGISSPALGVPGAFKAAWCDGYGRLVVINNHPSLYNTDSHGPKCVTCSTSATTAVIAAPGAGLCVYITKIAATNGSATLTRGDVYGASATATAMASLHMAASGGGFVMDYSPPIKALSNTAVNCRVKPSVSKCMFNVHFYVGPK